MCAWTLFQLVLRGHSATSPPRPKPSPIRPLPPSPAQLSRPFRQHLLRAEGAATRQPPRPVRPSRAPFGLLGSSAAWVAGMPCKCRVGRLIRSCLASFVSCHGAAVSACSASSHYGEVCHRVRQPLDGAFAKRHAMALSSSTDVRLKRRCISIHGRIRPQASESRSTSTHRLFKLQAVESLPAAAGAAG
jgi:hypothetical protein